MLTQWAIELRKESFFLNLNFIKAYDRINMKFMVQVMGTLEMPNSFNNKIRLLFYDAIVSLNFNNQVTEPFKHHRWLRQGCPLAPYLFIITYGRGTQRNC